MISIKDIPYDHYYEGIRPVGDFEEKTNTRTEIKDGISDEFEALVGCRFITLNRGVRLDRSVFIDTCAGQSWSVPSPAQVNEVY